MKLTVRIAGFKENDPGIQRMLDKKAELQEFCDEYESILKEQLPQYAIDGVLPVIQIVPDKKTMDGLRDFFKMISAGIFEKQPQFEWAVRKGAWPGKKVSCRFAGAIGVSFYVCGLPKEFPADQWKVFSEKLADFYWRWTDGCDDLPGLIYQLSDK